MAKGGKGTLLQGMSDCSPKASDSSTKLPTKTSVNSDATRNTVGSATNNLGPREA